MKKLIILLCIAIFTSTIINAQYKLNKTKYDFRTYKYAVGDPYNTGLSGIASFLIPGLGQMLCGETGRGLAFLGADIGCMVIYFSGVSKAMRYIENGEITQTGASSNGAGAMLAGMTGIVIIEIWSTIDAVRVAKVNNLAWRDSNGRAFKFQVEPYLNTSLYSYNKSIPLGLTLKASF